MDKDLAKLREIFSSGADEETREENLSQIAEWESSLAQLHDKAGWQEHDITKAVVTRARSAYVEHSLLLMRSRELTDPERFSLWAKQDACLWLISVASGDAKTEIGRIQADIKRALQSD